MEVNKHFLKLARIADDEHKVAQNVQKSVGTRYPFLSNEADNVDVIESWEEQLWSNDDDINNHREKNLIAFTLDALVQKSPTYTDKDFLLVRRQSQLEIWTLRDFKAMSIILCPESSEMKPKHWTAGRSAVVKKSDGNVTAGKTMVIDGRVRASPEGKSGFALYWIVTRVSGKSKDDLKLVNMESTYIEAECKLKVKVMEGHTWTIDDTDMPRFPVLINPKKIPKHTRLVALEDSDLTKMNDLMEKDKVKEEKAKEKAKDEKRKSTDSAKDEKPGKKAKM